MPESPPQEGARVEMIGYDAAGAPMTVTEPDAADVVAAEEKVRKAGGRVSFIRRWAPDRLKPPGISAEDFARFNELLASAIQRRVPLLEGVRELSRGAQGRRFQEALALVTGALRTRRAAERGVRVGAVRIPASLRKAAAGRCGCGQSLGRAARAEPQHPREPPVPEGRLSRPSFTPFCSSAWPVASSERSPSSFSRARSHPWPTRWAWRSRP